MMWKYARILLCGLALSCNALPALANFAITQGSGTSIFSIDSGTTPAGTGNCAAGSTECTASIPIDKSGTPLFATGNPGLVTGTGGTFPVTGTFWQATQPVSGTFWQVTQPISGSVTAVQPTGTNLHMVCDSGCASTGGTNSNFGSAFPSAGTAIGLTNGTNMVAWSATTNYGTAPAAIAVPAVNAFITGAVGLADASTSSGQTFSKIGANAVSSAPTYVNGDTYALTQSTGGALYVADSALLAAAQAGTGATGSAVPSSAIYIAGDALSAERTAATTGNLTGPFLDLTGKFVTSPYANRENYTRCAGSTTSGSAVTCTTGGMVASSGVKNYITGVQCFRTDAGTTTAFVTLNDIVATTIALPAGGGSNQPIATPLVTAANTAVTWTPSTALTTVYCNLQGYAGY